MPAGWLLGGLSLLAAAALAACGPVAPAPRAARGAPHPSSAATHRVSAGTAPTAITLAFAGDVHFTGRTAALLKDPATAFGPISSVLSLPTWPCSTWRRP
jgi:poly-gamma-glutamate synthesis protein (capsule biosynthesis protein)